MVYTYLRRINDLFKTMCIFEIMIWPLTRIVSISTPFKQHTFLAHDVLITIPILTYAHTCIRVHACTYGYVSIDVHVCICSHKYEWYICMDLGMHTYVYIIFNQWYISFRNFTYAGIYVIFIIIWLRVLIYGLFHSREMRVISKTFVCTDVHRFQIHILYECIYYMYILYFMGYVFSYFVRNGDIKMFNQS